MYHRVAPDGAPAGERYRVTPESFEEQLRWLRAEGYRSISLEEWTRAVHRHEPIRGRAVAITFDDGYRDFAEHAWPLLEKYGLSALVLLVAGEVGGVNRWDEPLGEEVPLLDWEEVRDLHGLGVEFGSHSVSHSPLTALSAEDVVRETALSRTVIARELDEAPAVFAYPHGDTDPAVQHLTGACGYTVGLTTRGGLATMSDSLLALPRVEVSGLGRFREFVAAVSGTGASA